MAKRKPLIAGNWKMNGSLADNAALLDTISRACQSGDCEVVDLAVFPPFVYLQSVIESLKDKELSVGAQCVSDYREGAYTGSVSAQMCADLGCQMVLAGHSERRHLLGESDAQVAAQVQRIIEAGCQPILCVGETKEERDRGETLSVIKRQLAAALALDDNRSELNHWIVAYEPVWAIGTGERAGPEDILGVHAFIREELRLVIGDLADSARLLYGGSVKANNAEELFALDNVDGALIGGASLDGNEFVEIAKLCCIYC